MLYLDLLAPLNQCSLTGMEKRITEFPYSKSLDLFRDNFGQLRAIVKEDNIPVSAILLTKESKNLYNVRADYIVDAEHLAYITGYIMARYNVGITGIESIQIVEAIA